MKTVIVIKKCQCCGTSFFPKTLWSVYCSAECSRKEKLKREKERYLKTKYKKVASAISDAQLYLTVSQAVAIFAVARTTLYSHIRHGKIKTVRMGKRGIRLNRNELALIYRTRAQQERVEVLPPKVKLYNMEPENCYTIGEATKKYNVGATYIYDNVRKRGIPIRYIGRYVYVPKFEIDNLFVNR